MAFGKTKIDKVDSLFSKMVRERDNYTCKFCGKNYGGPNPGCHNSHFWGRGMKGTRFDARNCDTLCFSCHMRHEGNKQGYYREYKLKTLESGVYELLEASARAIVKYGKFEKEQIYAKLKEQYKNKEHLQPGWIGVPLPLSS